MQTFLPYHPVQNMETGEWDFHNVVEVLDNKRLNKQAVEAMQILDILCGRFPDARFRNHPAVLQWIGHEWVLLDYLTDICMECRVRDIKCSIYDRLNGYTALMPNNSSQELPEWMERPEIFASHRSRLLFKGRCDSALEALKSVTSPLKGTTIRYWLISDDSPIVVSNEYVKDKMMQHRDVEQIEDYLFKQQAKIPPNFYRQYNWTERDTLPYVWPVTIAAIREQGIRMKAEEKRLLASKSDNDGYAG